MTGNLSKSLHHQLSNSQIYRDYERAFSEAANLPLTFRTTNAWNLAYHSKRHENPFCALIAQSNRSCAGCLEVQQKLSNITAHRPKTVTCFAGFCEAAVPVCLGNELIGLLQTGQIALKKPSKVRFNRITKQLVEWGVKTDLKKLEEAYFHNRVLSQRQYQSMLRLLEIFAQHLSIVANQIAIQHENLESPMIKKAKEFIQKHKSEKLSLSEVSKSVNMSTFYFCKMFKKATGLNFTDYLSRVRIEEAKNLLLNPNLRVSEIAYEIGFQSLTHFNRVFHKIVGRSPTSYRKVLPAKEQNRLRGWQATRDERPCSKLQGIGSL